MNKQPSIWAHLRDILLLPFTVTVIIPYLIYDSKSSISGHLFISVIGVFILLGGLTLFIYTVSLFRKIGRGTLAPWSPTQTLIIKGPYRYCRNPMISGVLFILLGEGLILNSVHILTWAVVFFVINTIYFVVKEEPSLQQRFGEDYRRYKKNVPRWIPRVKPYSL